MGVKIKGYGIAQPLSALRTFRQILTHYDNGIRQFANWRIVEVPIFAYAISVFS